MGAETGGILPELVGKLCQPQKNAGEQPQRASSLTDALCEEARRERGAVKRLMRWSGASEVAVKARLRGDSQPRADHLIALIAQSDQILTAVLAAAGCKSISPAAEVMAVRRPVEEVAGRLNTLVVGQ